MGGAGCWAGRLLPSRRVVCYIQETSCRNSAYNVAVKRVSLGRAFSVPSPVFKVFKVFKVSDEIGD